MRHAQLPRTHTPSPAEPWAQQQWPPPWAWQCRSGHSSGRSSCRRMWSRGRSSGGRPRGCSAAVVAAGVGACQDRVGTRPARAAVHWLHAVAIALLPVGRHRVGTGPAQGQRRVSTMPAQGRHTASTYRVPAVAVAGMLCCPRQLTSLGGRRRFTRVGDAFHESHEA